MATTSRIIAVRVGANWRFPNIFLFGFILIVFFLAVSCNHLPINRISRHWVETRSSSWSRTHLLTLRTVAWHFETWFTSNGLWFWFCLHFFLFKNLGQFISKKTFPEHNLLFTTAFIGNCIWGNNCSIDILYLCDKLLLQLMSLWADSFGLVYFRVPVPENAFTSWCLRFHLHNWYLTIIRFISFLKLLINIDESLAIKRGCKCDRFPGRLFLLFIGLIEEGFIPCNGDSTLSPLGEHNRNRGSVYFFQVGEHEYLLFVHFFDFRFWLAFRGRVSIRFDHQPLQLQFESSYLHIVGGEHGQHIKISHSLSVFGLLYKSRCTFL